MYLLLLLVLLLLAHQVAPEEKLCLFMPGNVELAVNTRNIAIAISIWL